MSLKLSRSAEKDLRQQIAYIAERNPEAARRLAVAIARLLDELDRASFDGPEIELRSGRTVRTWPLPPLRIYYERRGRILYVVRIHHQARRPITQ